MATSLIHQQRTSLWGGMWHLFGCQLFLQGLVTTYASRVDAIRLCSLVAFVAGCALRGIIGTCFYERVPQVRRLENVKSAMQIDVDKGGVD